MVEVGCGRFGKYVCCWRKKVRTRSRNGDGQTARRQQRNKERGKNRTSKRRVVHIQRLIDWVFLVGLNKRKRIADEVGWMMNDVVNESGDQTRCFQVKQQKKDCQRCI